VHDNVDTDIPSVAEAHPKLMLDIMSKINEDLSAAGMPRATYRLIKIKVIKSFHGTCYICDERYSSKTKTHGQ
jgi:hypothetical protein